METSKQVVEQMAPHSVELTTNAKGGVQACVKVYADDPMVAADRAVAILGHLRETYPGLVAANGGGNG